jgi:CRP-like cAMP-binding protein
MEIAATVEPADFGPGSPIIRQGEVGDSFYIILDGECEVIYQRPGGGDILIDSHKAGEYFGETALIRAAPRNASVRAGEQPVRLLPISAALFDRLVNESPTFRQEMESVAAARSQRIASGGA